MWNNRFEGWYFKHQKGEKTIAFIPGRAKNGAFIQVVTNEVSRHFDVPSLHVTDKICAGRCTFGTDGVTIDLPGIRGEIQYETLTPLHSDIMGPFRFLPMECRHSVISMRHKLTGSLMIEGYETTFDGGLGYIEKDSGRSFPSKYLWLQCNDFPTECSVMVSIAQIPFVVLHFTGCICAIVYEGREYRLATYGGVKIQNAGPKHILLSQGQLMLEIDIFQTETGHPLKSPLRGNMTGIVKECNRTVARFRLWESGRLVFDLTSRNAGFEYFG